MQLVCLPLDVAPQEISLLTFTDTELEAEFTDTRVTYVNEQ